MCFNGRGSVPRQCCPNGVMVTFAAGSVGTSGSNLEPDHSTTRPRSPRSLRSLRSLRSIRFHLLNIGCHWLEPRHMSGHRWCPHFCPWACLSAMPVWVYSGPWRAKGALHENVARAEGNSAMRTEFPDGTIKNKTIASHIRT